MLIDFFNKFRGLIESIKQTNPLLLISRILILIYDVTKDKEYFT